MDPHEVDFRIIRIKILLFRTDLDDLILLNKIFKLDEYHKKKRGGGLCPPFLINLAL